MTAEEAIEAVVGAWRERSPHGAVLPLAQWFDLDASERAVAFAQTVVTRRIEAALDPDGLSSTARAVLARIEASGR